MHISSIRHQIMRLVRSDRVILGCCDGVELTRHDGEGHVTVYGLLTNHWYAEHIEDIDGPITDENRFEHSGCTVVLKPTLSAGWQTRGVHGPRSRNTPLVSICI